MSKCLTAGLAALALVVGAVLCSQNNTANAITLNCSASNETELTACLASGNSGDVIDITITNDFSVSAQNGVGAGKTVNLHSDALRRTLTRDTGFGGTLFDLANADSTLNITNLILDGSKDTMTITGTNYTVRGASNAKLQLGTGFEMQNFRHGSGWAPPLFFQGNSRIEITGNAKFHDNVGVNPSVLQLWGASQALITDTAEFYNNVTTVAGVITVSDNASFTMSGNAKIHDNIATSSQVAAIYDNSANTTFTITGNVEIYNNSAAQYCGAMRITSNNAEISGNVKIYNNSAGSFGGAMCVYNTVHITDNVKIFDNTANGTTADIGVDYDMGSGAIHLGNTARLTIDGAVEIYGNRALANANGAGNGGAIGMALHFQNPLAIGGDVRIYNNTADGSGGGVWVDYTDLDKLNVGAGVVFSGNKASALYNLQPADEPLYAAQIFGTRWSLGLNNGYNNYDIAYTFGNPIPEPVVPQPETPTGPIVPGAPNTGVFRY